MSAASTGRFRHLATVVSETVRSYAPRLTGAVIVAAVFFLLVMADSLYQRLARINAAESDNLIWVFAQLEVDASNLDLAAAEFVHAESETQYAQRQADLRHAFDIYYSRVLIVESAMTHLAHNPDAAALFSRVQWARDRLDKVVYRSDPNRRQDLVALRDMTRSNRALARELSVASLQDSVRQSAAERQSQKNTLIAYLAVTTALIAVLSLSLAIVYYLSHKLKSRTTELTRLAANLSKMIEAANDAIIVTDRGGLIIQYNHSAERIFGHARSDAIGARLSALIIPPQHRARHDQGMRIYQHTGRSGIINGERTVLPAINAQGQEFPCEVSVVSDTDIDGNPIYVSFVRDISERLEAERKLDAALQQARRDAAAKSRFLAVMSHEMRTPLHGMIASLGMIDGTGVSAKDHELIQTARACSGDALEQIEDILDIARQEASGDYRRPQTVFAPTRVASELLASLKPRADEAGTVLRLLAPDAATPREFSGDARSFRRGLQNLAVNALKFTREGVVEIALRTVRDDGDKTTLHVEVSDTGCGIPAAEQERIFEDFETSGHHEGTGLGLGIMRRCIERMGGTHGMHSVVGKGSDFWFEVTLENASQRHAPGPSRHDGHDADRGRFSGMCVLVVDDNPVNLSLMEEMLARLGCRVTAARDGMTAVEHARETAFDLVLLDINMPYMDGIETAAAIKRTGCCAKAIFIAVTAMATREDRQRLLEIGIADIVTKPLGPVELTRRLGEIMHERAGGAAHAGGAATAQNLDGMCRDLYDAVGPDVAGRFAEAIRADVEAVIASMAGDENDNSDGGLAGLAHRAAGSAAVAGMTDLRDALIEIETAARAGERHDLEEKIPGLRRHLLPLAAIG